jgi:hypothetical protein
MLFGARSRSEEQTNAGSRYSVRVADENEAAGTADASRGVIGEASRWREKYLWSQGGLCDQTSQKSCWKNSSGVTSLQTPYAATWARSSNSRVTLGTAGSARPRPHSPMGGPSATQRKLAVGTVVNCVAALRFFFRCILKRRFPPDSIPYPNYTHHRVPKILSLEEVTRLIDTAGNLQAPAILMVSRRSGSRHWPRRTLVSR